MKRFKTICLLLPIAAFWLIPCHAEVHFKEVEAVSIAIEEIYLEGQNDFFVPPGAEGQLAAKTDPDDLRDKVRWAEIGKSDGLEFGLDQNTGLLTIESASAKGWIIVQASAEGCAPLSQRIEIDCPCPEEGGSCESTAGTGDFENNSVEVRLSLGRVEGGRSAGDLLLYAEEPLAILSMPEAMVINGSSEQVIPFYREGTLEQILTPQVIVNFLRFSHLKYEIHFYDIAFRGQRLENGSYSLDPRAVPLVVWRIENPDATGETIDELLITEFRNGEKREFFYRYQAVDHGWTLMSGNGLKIESKAETTNADGDRVIRTTIAGADGKAVRVAETVFREFPFGKRRIRETIDPDGFALATEYRYGTGQGSGYGQLTARIDSEGGWVRYIYDAEGRLVQEVRPYLDAAIDAAGDKTVVVTNSYAPVDITDSGAPRDRHRPRRVIETTRGIETARSYHVYTRGRKGERVEITERCIIQGKPYGHPSNLRSVSCYYGSGGNGPEAGRIKSRLSEDGRLTRYTYEKGRFRFSPDPAKCRFIPGDGKARRTTVIHGTEKHPEGIAFQTIKETIITDAMGREKLLETFAKTEKGFARIDWRLNTHDRLGRVIETLHANGIRTESAWGCCGKMSETDADGITTRYTYDALKRVTAKTNEATGVVTSFTYDAVGRLLTTTKSNDGLSLTQENRHDSAGRLAAQMDTAGLVTHFTKDKMVSTSIHPGGATEITSRHLDGRLDSMTGTAVVPRYYRYGVDPDGSQWTTVYFGGKDSPRWEKTTRDLAGRVIRVEEPGFAGIETTRNHYDRKGRLIRTKVPGRGDALYVYDELGNPIMGGLDVDGNGRLVAASMDRIALTHTGFRLLDGAWWKEIARGILACDNQDKKTILSVQRQRLTGWRDHVAAETIVTDIQGNETRTIVLLDRFKHTRIQKVFMPDSSIPAQTVYVDGRLAATTSKTGLTMTFGYDALGRRVAVEDPRKGVSHLHYDPQGRLDFVEDASGSRARFAYDPQTGRKNAEYNALNKAARYAFNSRGQLIRTWGDVPYPVEYAYDELGQMVSMRTFRSGTGWDGDTWPTDTGPGDQTRWHYHPATGLILAKEDARGHRTSYGYSPGGALASRIWARRKNGKPLQTDYRYDAVTGDLVMIDYSGDTPDIAYAYDRLGRKVRVSDAAGIHHFAYNDRLLLETDRIVGKQVYQIDRHYDDLGRKAGFQIDGNYRVSYGYDDKGRFDSVDWFIGEQTGDARYNYLSQSDLLAGMENSAGLSVHYDYEPRRDAKTAVTNAFNDRLISRYEYQYDRLGRRINVKNHGEAFYEAVFWLYGYNDRNEVISAGRFYGKDLKDQTRPKPELDRVYQYDPIGNRISAVEGAETIHYQTNSLNQYEKIERPLSQVEGLVYDADGNLVEDGRFYYSWNGENRLIAVEPKKPLFSDKRLEFTYDYAGRRITKKVFVYGDGSYALSATIRFIYDGWNVVKEIKTENEVSEDKLYVWGLDLSRSLQGAGGVGGLIAVSDGVSAQSFFYDANGNVGQLIRPAKGNLVANYQYDPFGKIIQGTGEFVPENDHGYSTNYFDETPGFYYYGKRFYSPREGRWIKKDPVFERGGTNLYAFVSNNAISEVDYLGYDSFFNDIANFADGILTGARIVVGVAGSVIDLDAFRDKGQSPIKQNSKNNCQFLITINGMFNFYEEAVDFPKDLRQKFKDKFGKIDNFGFVNNPTTFITDVIQVGFLEIRGIGIPSITTAKFVGESYNHAVEHKCDCIDIYIIAHSQGAAILNNALPLIPDKIKPHLRVLTLGAEQFVYENALGFVMNYDSKGDWIPELSLWNKLISEVSVPEEDIPGHGRINYINYWSENGLPKGFFR